MFNILKSEFTKLITLKSTYIVSGVLVILAGLAGAASAAIGLPAGAGAGQIVAFNAQSSISGAISLGASIFTVIAVLIVINEYRYNTISYTLTASRSRLTVFFAKMITALGYGLAVAVVASLLAVLGASIVLASTGATIVMQEFNVGSLLLHEFLHISFYVITGLSLGFMIRSIVVPIVIVFVLPVIESLSSLLLKEGAQYLPFSSFNALAKTGAEAAAVPVILIAFVYIIILAGSAFALFSKRDA